LGLFSHHTAIDLRKQNLTVDLVGRLGRDAAGASALRASAARAAGTTNGVLKSLQAEQLTAEQPVTISREPLQARIHPSHRLGESVADNSLLFSKVVEEYTSSGWLKLQKNVPRQRQLGFSRRSHLFSQERRSRH
jgi:hypothetical protein